MGSPSECKRGLKEGKAESRYNQETVWPNENNETIPIKPKEQKEYIALACFELDMWKLFWLETLKTKTCSSIHFVIISGHPTR